MEINQSPGAIACSISVRRSIRNGMRFKKKFRARRSRTGCRSPNTQLNPDNIWLRLTPPAGDIAFRFLEYIRSQQERQQRRAMSLRQTPLWRDVSDRYPDGGGAPESAVVVCDINKEMLKVGRQRADSRGVTTGLSWVVGDAEELLFNDDQFDLYTIAFGIRNVTHIDQALKEALRVLKPGGRFLCLEFKTINNHPIYLLFFGSVKHSSA
uniref:2-methoxy-6-polyprenyl-1,4-benzoquinol methylase, mitochondrial n=1 Tax=Oryzias melastigma TaxID=30732 RepID=A0A3B3D8G3_ORYME